MEQIRYEDSAFELELEYPSHWAAQSITGVTVGIKDTSANELLAAQAATLWDGTLLADASRMGMYIDVAATTAPRLGARYRIHETTAADVANNEDVVCTDFEVLDTDQYRIHLAREVQFDHSTGENVWGCYATYSADFSDTDDYSKGKELVFTWTPAGSDDLPYTEMAEIASAALATSNLWQKFETLYHTEWERISGRGNEKLNELEKLLSDMFRAEFRARSLDMNRIVDQDLLTSGMLKFTRMTILTGGGDAEETELANARKEWNMWFRAICENRVIWEDIDQDGVREQGEEQTHGFGVFERYY